MADMIRYIFSSLNDTETFLRVISKSLRKQVFFNRSVIFFMALHLIVQEMEIRSINRDLEALQKEIKELKKTEGD